MKRKSRKEFEESALTRGQRMYYVSCLPRYKKMSMWCEFNEKYTYYCSTKNEAFFQDNHNTRECQIIQLNVYEKFR